MKIGLLCALLLALAHGEPPQAVSAQLVGLTFHPGGGTQPEYYPRKLDRGGWWVAQLGGALAYDLSLWEAFGLRAKAAWYRDCADHLQSIGGEVSPRAVA